MPQCALLMLLTAIVAVEGAAALSQQGTAQLPGMATPVDRRSQMTIVAGTLTGTVRDQARSLVSGLAVTIRLETDANVAPHRATTDKEGRFRFSGLPLGTYCLVVEHPGSGPTRRDGIQVRGAQETNVAIVIGEASPPPPPGAPRRRPCVPRGR